MHPDEDDPDEDDTADGADKRDDGGGRRAVLGCLLGLLFIAALVACLVRLVRWLTGGGPGSQVPAQTGLVPTQLHPVPPSIYRRPDPFIYDQYYLGQLGYAVSWHNPDFRLEDPAEVVLPGQPRTPVQPTDLQPAKTYDVIARVWNGSLSAPAVHMPVHFSYLEFGIGTTKVSIGTTHADLSVKGGSACPAFARQSWTTPATPGHYCLQAELLWPDDANPANNLGQHNTDVKPLNSPNAEFTFPVRNDADWRREMALEVDAYAIPPLPDCSPAGETRPAPARDRSARRHAREDHPVPPGWVVDLVPAQLDLGPGEVRDVTVHITAPDGFSGQQAFNVHAYADGAIAGGVTLYVHG